MSNSQTSDNPLLTTLRSRIPGETFSLPSRGVFYTNGELSDDVKNGEVHVFPLTTLDEIILKTPDKLLSGKAVEEVFSRCIPQVLKPSALLSKDVDFLMMCLRLLSYGETVDITYTHTCERAKEHEYEVELRPFIAKTRPIDPTILDSTFSIVLPSQQRVQLRPVLYGNVMQMYVTSFELSRLEEGDEKSKAVQEQLLDVIVDTIVSVDDVTNRDHIKEWVKHLPPMWSDQLGEAISNASNWGPSTTVDLVCKDCGAEMKVDVPLNPIGFFS